MVRLHFLFLIFVTSKRVSGFCWLFCNFQVLSRCEKIAYLVEMFVLTWWSTWFHLLCKLPPTRKVDLEWKETKNTFNKTIKIYFWTQTSHIFTIIWVYFLHKNNFLEMRNWNNSDAFSSFASLEHNK